MAAVDDVSWLADIKVIDVDTHLTEPHDLWTSRAPKNLMDRVPQVRDVDGQRSWTFDGVVLGPARAASVIRKDGTKAYGSTELFTMTIDEAHPGASQVGPRLEYMDDAGIWAQIVYPNTVGFGGQTFAKIQDMDLRLACTQIWNDAMADMQEESSGRICGMALLPWWDRDESLVELERVRSLGLKGVMINADPQTEGLPDLGERFWDPLWAGIADSRLPLNFHIGASIQQLSYFGTSPWGSQSDDVKLALGSSMIYLSNARVLSNFIFSGILERHPDLKLVSVESGLGWVPFVLEALDYQQVETAPSTKDYLSLKPSEYFRRQIYACFWFESEVLVPMIEACGVDNCMFETDFPHPTSLYPNAVQRVARSLESVDDTFRRKVLSGNAAKLYNIAV